MKRELSLLAVDNALMLICEEMSMPTEQVRQYVTEAVETAKDGFMWHPHNSYNPANLAHFCVVLYTTAHPELYGPALMNQWEGVLYPMGQCVGSWT